MPTTEEPEKVHISLPGEQFSRDGILMSSLCIDTCVVTLLWARPNLDMISPLLTSHWVLSKLGVKEHELTCSPGVLSAPALARNSS